MGRLIVIDGLDGSGKQTQTQLLARRLTEKNIGVKQITFPTYTESSALIRLYLDGELGALDKVNVYAASTFYAVDRYASYCRDWKEDYLANKLVLTDRYVTANIIHQMGKLPKDQWEDYLNWVNDLEYVRFGLPKPDLVLYLELPIEASCRLLEKRYAGDDSKKDLHERDSAYLRACHETAAFAARRLGWQVVHCGDGAEGIRTPEEIANEIEALMTQRLFKEV
ncbi:MAG: deoxynucleoside kinase [Clostridia bacterium]|nr:deoxynucleoside kinase [Clostridia bacterium]